MPLGFKKKKGAFATIGRCLSFIRQRPPPQRNEILSPAFKKKTPKKNWASPEKKKVNFFFLFVGFCIIRGCSKIFRRGKNDFHISSETICHRPIAVR